MAIRRAHGGYLGIEPGQIATNLGQIMRENVSRESAIQEAEKERRAAMFERQAQRDFDASQSSMVRAMQLSEQRRQEAADEKKFNRIQSLAETAETRLRRKAEQDIAISKQRENLYGAQADWYSKRQPYVPSSSPFDPQKKSVEFALKRATDQFARENKILSNQIAMFGKNPMMWSKEQEDQINAQQEKVQSIGMALDKISADYDALRQPAEGDRGPGQPINQGQEGDREPLLLEDMPGGEPMAQPLYDEDYFAGAAPSDKNYIQQKAAEVAQKMVDLGAAGEGEAVLLREVEKMIRQSHPPGIPEKDIQLLIGYTMTVLRDHYQTQGAQ
jgi:hypothetical protein